MSTFAIVYWTVAAIVFAVCFVTSDRAYGRGSTGEPDFEFSFFMALLWPLFAFVAAVLISYEAWKRLHETEPTSMQKVHKSQSAKGEPAD